MLLSIAEIERRYGVSEYHVYRWVEEGQLHAVREGKRFKYPDWEVLACLRIAYGRLSVA